MKHIENIERNLHRMPEFQDPLLIELKEISNVEGKDSIPEIEVKVNADTPISEVEKKVKDKLVKQNWWLQEYWSKKNVPKEQITIKIPDGNFEVFNFGESLKQRHFDELGNIVKIFSQINNGKFFESIKYVLIDDIQKPNPHTGEEMCGYGPVEEKAVKIYPNGIKFKSHRIPTASNFTGTLIHEFSHTIDNEFKNEWIKEFGWTQLDKPKPSPGGSYQYYEVKNPKNCVSDYAKFSPDEDICESMAAYLTQYENLDPERREFIKSWISINDTEDSSVSMTRKTNSEIELPRVKEPVIYEKKKRKKFSIK